MAISSGVSAIMFLSATEVSRHQQGHPQNLLHCDSFQIPSLSAKFIFDFGIIGRCNCLFHGCEVGSTTDAASVIKAITVTCLGVLCKSMVLGVEETGSYENSMTSLETRRVAQQQKVDLKAPEVLKLQHTARAAAEALQVHQMRVNQCQGAVNSLKVELNNLQASATSLPGTGSGATNQVMPDPQQLNQAIKATESKLASAEHALSQSLSDWQPAQRAHEVAQSNYDRAQKELDQLEQTHGELRLHHQQCETEMKCFQERLMGTSAVLPGRLLTVLATLLKAGTDCKQIITKDGESPLVFFIQQISALWAKAEYRQVSKLAATSVGMLLGKGVKKPVSGTDTGQVPLLSNVASHEHKNSTCCHYLHVLKMDDMCMKLRHSRCGKALLALMRKFGSVSLPDHAEWWSGYLSSLLKTVLDHSSTDRNYVVNPSI
eukprot:scaffold56350_cov52-Prasinocladus_malaysianus.AAC.3